MPAPNTPDPRGRFHLILLLLLAAAFAAAILWILNLRLNSGDSYPPYSSFRTDPIGSRALHDALNDIHTISTTRNTRRIQSLQPNDQSAILFLGLNPRQLEWQDMKERTLIESWLDQGCRIVIALSPLPEDYKDRAEKRGWKKQDKDKNEKKDDKSTQKEHEADQDTEITLTDEGIFGLTARREAEKPRNLPQSAQASLTGIDLPNWNGSHILEFKQDSEWTVLATAGGQPTIAEFQRGTGSLVITTDAYPFSNEAQTKDRHTPFLLALLGGKSRITFDESHLGVVNEPGLVKLLRQYHLHGILAGGILLFAILLWQGSGSLIPVDPNKDLGSDSSGTSSGRDSSDGLVALLESGLPPHRLLDECINRYLAARPIRPPSEETILQARITAGQSGNGKLPADYLKISRLFSHSTKPHPTDHHGNH